MGAVDISWLMKVFNSGIFPMLFCLWFMRRQDAHDKARAQEQQNMMQLNLLLQRQADVISSLEDTVERQTHALTRVDGRLSKLLDRPKAGD